MYFFIIISLKKYFLINKPAYNSTRDVRKFDFH